MLLIFYSDPLTLEIEVFQLREMVEQQDSRLMELEEQVNTLLEEVATISQLNTSTIFCSMFLPQGQSSSSDVMSPTPVTPSTAHSRLATRPTIDTSKLWTEQEVLRSTGDINVCSAGRFCSAVSWLATLSLVRT